MDHRHWRARYWRDAILASASVALLALPAAAQIQTGGRGGGLSGRPGSGDPTQTNGGSSTPTDEQLLHVLDRVTYGATEEDIALARRIGVENFIRLQLQPELIGENPQLATKLALLPPTTTAVGDENWQWEELYADYVLRARYSNRQLQQMMTEFWSNHFVTGLTTSGSAKVGWYAQLKFDPTTEYPTAVYYNLRNQRPYFAYYDGSRWQTQSIENTSRNGWFLSLAYNPVTGLPAVAYYSERYQRLQFHTYDGSSWSTEDVVDASADVGWYASLAFDSAGVAYIAYHDRTNDQLKLARGSIGAWTTEVVDTASGTHASLAIDRGGNPAIAYHDAANRQLKYAEWRGASWRIEIADAGPGVGTYASLAFDAMDRPAVAYRDGSASTLKYALRNPGWNSGTVDGGGDVGNYASLAFNAAGAPSIAYYEDAPNYDLRLARWNGGTSSFDVEVVQSGQPIRGEFASLAFSPATGEPAIAFYDGSEFELHYNIWTGSAWTAQDAADGGRTDYVRVAWEMVETDGFRANAFGKFRDLLSISATSPAMMLYLNNDQNTAGNGNENYARELLELHTVGVDGGYVQDDVEKAALALTGWTTVERTSAANCEAVIDDFCYNHNAHDGQWREWPARTIMGKTFEDDSAATLANYMKQGNELLDFLSVHPSTARFVCGKLIQKFVDDTPPARLLGECQETFLGSDGDIRRVLESILLSEEFLDDPSFRLSKVRDPFELMLAIARHLEVDTDLYALWNKARDIGMPLFRQDVPTGWAEVASEWISTYAWLQRWRAIEDVVHRDIVVYSYEPYQSYTTTVDPWAMVQNHDVGTRGGSAGAEAVVEFFTRRLLRNLIGSAERADLIDCLTNGNPATFDIDDPNTPGRMLDMLGVMLGYPVYQQH